MQLRLRQRADCSTPGGTNFAFFGGHKVGKEKLVMLWTVLFVLFALWLLGVITHIGGAVVHLLLVVALVLFVVDLLSGRRVAF